jgi:hypothetical protein
MRLIHTAFIFIATIALSLTSAAAVEPSFRVERATWHATDIVEVVAAEDGGQFTVLETWKGNLRHGDQLQVPELRPEADAVAPSPRALEDLGHDYCYKIPKQIVGMQLVLFLTRAHESADGKGSTVPLEWNAPGPISDLKSSAVWIDGEHTYCFRQVINPGYSFLVDCETSETKLKARALEVIRSQQRLATIAELQDTGSRAEFLREYLISNLHLGPPHRIREASYFALEELEKCGRPGLPVIRAMLDDPEFSSDAETLRRIFVQLGGKK